MENTTEVVRNRRTIRKFAQRALPDGFLQEMADLARLAPSGANLQPLKYITVERPEMREAIFPLTKWAGYLPADEGTPGEEERPAGYLVLLTDPAISKAADIDAGLAAENAMLAAAARGIGSCMLGAIDRPGIAELLCIPPELRVHSLLAFGYPAMRAEACVCAGDVKYFYDGEVLRVPKRPLGEVLIGRF